MKIGLVLEGGGSRGIYTAGVLDCFMDHGVVVDKCYGISAGGINAASYVSSQRGRSLHFWKECVSDKRYGNMKNLMKTGMYFINTPDVYLEPLDKEAFANSKTKLEIGVTCVETGKCDYFEVSDPNEVDAFITASAALPIVSRFNMIRGKYYLDGGLSDSIPCKRAIDDGCDKVICILTQHKGFVKKKTKSYGFVRLKYRRYPNLVKAIGNRHNMYNEQLEYVYNLDSSKCFIIQPKEPVEVSRLENDKEKLQKLYDEGYKDALDKINEIKSFININ